MASGLKAILAWVGARDAPFTTFSIEHRVRPYFAASGNPNVRSFIRLPLRIPQTLIRPIDKAVISAACVFRTCSLQPISGVRVAATFGEAEKWFYSRISNACSIPIKLRHWLSSAPLAYVPRRG